MPEYTRWFENGVDDLSSPEEIPVQSSIRLSDVEVPFNLASRDERLQFIDDIMQEFLFQILMMRKRWGLHEGGVLILGITAIILGAWDLGIGELAGGGDYRRVGLFGENSGLLHVADFSLMLALLSLISWIGVFGGLWIRYPIMRENIVYLTVANLGVQFGHIYSHSNSTKFPFGAELGDWGGVAVGNLIMLFLSIIVVHRAVIETRDIHVQERHNHPDPRKVAREWRDHSLRVWSIGLGCWIILTNISAWSGSHSVALRPPIEQDMTLFVAMHVISGIAAILLLIHILWYPQFMLGSSGDRIQSTRAREVAGEYIPRTTKNSQGICPICNVETPALKLLDGSYEVPCATESCQNVGVPGTSCVECNAMIPSRITCQKCGSSTTIVSHFSRSEAW
ncbi:MAG TPA: hypothetical protein QF508_04515 [Candidatus Thalassarchaeaceae archaeon]|jgi:hypothetical protein|nr:hypothetical protein [Candidatus Thalassarchaeaceae archaeon]HJO42650.1 hypothetical protein [Candidatus Thalassarchaeaceae archaeon]|tara:strand:- start:572 stop:1756 length:1185 start_codon:yes stop_codon:yes gene_type:complete